MNELIDTRETLNEYIHESSSKLKFNKDMEKDFKAISKILKTKAKQFDQAEKDEAYEKMINEGHREEPGLDQLLP